MVTRFLILLAVTIVVLGGWSLLRLWRTVKLRSLAAYAPLSKFVPAGKAAVVAFTAPYCRDCDTLQAPALARLQAGLRESVTVTTLSALENPDLVDQLGILTVPSTVVVDARGNVKHLNLGYASETRLRKQLELASG